MTTPMKILFCRPASALRDSMESQRTLHTFANRTSQRTDQNLQKSAILSFAKYRFQNFFHVGKLKIIF